MFNSGTYDPSDNGSGFEDEVNFDKNKKYKSLNDIKDDDISESFKEFTGTGTDGYGEEDFEGEDDAW